MGCSTNFVISLILFSSLFLSQMSAATGKIPHQQDDERDSKYYGGYPDHVPECYPAYSISGQVVGCPPTITSTKP